MNSQLKLKKDHIVSLLRKLGKHNRIIAPVQNEYGDTLYTEIKDLDNAVISLETQPQNSLKGFLLPQKEKISNYAVDRDQEGRVIRYNFYPYVSENIPTIYFGVRSCDMFGVMYTDMIFLHAGERDLYYEQRRRNAIFITLACNKPFPNCFCNATRSGPFMEIGYDLQLTDLGDYFFVDTGRVHGIKLVKTWEQFFHQTTEADKKSQFQLSFEARGLFQKHVHVDLAIKMLVEEGEPVDVLQQLSARCQDCAGCAYICPTCTCFTISDCALDEDNGERIRSWDACTFSGFTRMAGDHNPVDRGSQKIRKRFLHKLLHDVQKHGRSSCVGCGRCVDMCFGGVDIVRFVEMLSEKVGLCSNSEL